MGKHVYTKTGLTGGGDTALDGIDGNLLNNLDVGIVTAGGVIYFYVLDNDNSSAESAPAIISPDKNYGTKRWILQALNAATLTAIGTNLYSDNAIEIGYGLTGNNYAIIDFRGDDTYSDYGLRVVRGNTGANSTSQIIHRGTGDFGLTTIEAAGISFYTSNTVRGTITFDGQFYWIGNVSALSFTDRTKYPEKEQAYAAIASMTANAGQVDHDKLDPFIKGPPDIDAEGKETPTRDIGATLSCLVEVVKDLVARIADLTARLEKVEKK